MVEVARVFVGLLPLLTRPSPSGHSACFPSKVVHIVWRKAEELDIGVGRDRRRKVDE